ncbi:MAG: LrgB family protein [Litorilituus sp.]|jgi:putative effector of murein hydrolase|nr:LrgB family protein [Litorilituus sp.]
MLTDWFTSLNAQPSSIYSTLVLSLLTLILYQSASWLQQRCQFIWLNPMIIAILLIIPFLLFTQIDYQSYRQSTQFIHHLLEPATVALGFPLYQQLRTIKYHWRALISLLTLSVIIVITISFLSAMLLIHQQEIAIALSLKSVTTPIGIALTEQLSGDSSITPFAITIAGFSGALLGPRWLKLINVHSKIATGLAIGSASHVIGSIILTRKDPSIGAYSSVALIISAVLTAMIIPLLIPILMLFFK